MSDRIEKSIELNAPIERVWRALTDHNEFGEWFRVKLDGPFAPGEVATGRITYPGFEHVKWEARIERMEASRLFSFTWHPYAVESRRRCKSRPHSSNSGFNRLRTERA
jgi:uncharacterized protein YndB with AHSA1/START domain